MSEAFERRKVEQLELYVRNLHHGWQLPLSEENDRLSFCSGKNA
jgi:hypothetical protein